LCGIVQILLCKSERDHLKQAFKNLALVLNIGAIVLLILSGQPYPAVVFFALLLAKGATMYFRQK
jgi:hypothetical protein